MFSPPILLHDVECYSLIKADLKFQEFVHGYYVCRWNCLNQWKLNLQINVDYIFNQHFNFTFPSESLEKRNEKNQYKKCPMH